MQRCEWCGKRVEDHINYVDAIGDSHIVCKECYKTVENCECRKCGDAIDNSMMINGLCMTCIQADMMVKSKKKEEARLGVDNNIEEEMSSEIAITNADYEKWLTIGNTFSPNDMKTNKELRRLWIMVKLNMTGVYEPEVISKHIGDIESILDRNLSKLVGKTCRFIIADTAEKRKFVRQQEVLDYEREIYIVKV